MVELERNVEYLLGNAFCSNSSQMSFLKCKFIQSKTKKQLHELGCVQCNIFLLSTPLQSLPTQISSTFWGLPFRCVINSRRKRNCALKFQWMFGQYCLSIFGNRDVQHFQSEVLWSRLVLQFIYSYNELLRFIVCEDGFINLNKSRLFCI